MIERLKRGPVRRWMVVVGALVLSACTGGVLTASGVGTGGTGVVQGTVTGFGSVLIDGNEFETFTPKYLAGTTNSDMADASATDVDLGDQVQIRLDASGNPSTIYVAPELTGAITQLTTSPTTFVVNGVLVRVNQDATVAPVTIFEGFAGAQDLQNGEQVEVHGAFGMDASGQSYVMASLIEHQPPTSPVRRVTGPVGALDLQAGTMTVAGTPVDVSASTVVTPASATLANGQIVSVWSNQPPASGAIVADAVTVHTLQGQTGSVVISGVASNVSGVHFDISGIPVAVDSANAGVAAQINDGDYVIVKGEIGTSTGIVSVSSLTRYKAAALGVEIRGNVTGYADAAHFHVRGVPIDGSQAMVTVSGNASGLAQGTYVDVAGYIDPARPSIVTATKISVTLPSPDNVTVDYQGVVSQYDAGTGSFSLTALVDGSPMTFPVVLASNVAYSNGASGQIADGVSLEVVAHKTSTGLSAYAVKFLAGDSADPSVVQVSGVAYDVTPTSFVVDGTSIGLNGTVPQGGTLADGDSVEVAFTASAGVYTTQAVRIDP